MPFDSAFARGTWTPTVLGGAGVVKGHTYTLQNGTYVRLGNLVFVHCQVIINALGTIDGSVVVIGGLPFPIRADANYRPVGTPRWASVTFVNIPGATGVQGTDYVSMLTFATGAASVNLTDAGLLAGSSFSLSLAYETEV
jgi:hypothetical protein